MFVCYLVIYYGNKLPPYYVGSTSLKRIEQGYCGSVSSIKYRTTFNLEVKENRHLFQVFVLSSHLTRDEATAAELTLQQQWDVVKSDSFYNESYASIGGMCGRDVKGKNNPMYGKKHSEETKKKISLRHTGRTFVFTDEHKKNMGKSRKGRVRAQDSTGKIYYVNKDDIRLTTNELTIKSYAKSKTLMKRGSTELREHLSRTLKGKKKSLEMRENLSKTNKGRKRLPFSQEWRDNISKAQKGKKLATPRFRPKGLIYKESTCPHCKYTGRGGNMKKLHFDRCKQKV